MLSRLFFYSKTYWPSHSFLPGSQCSFCLDLIRKFVPENSLNYTDRNLKSNALKMQQFIVISCIIHNCCPDFHSSPHLHCPLHICHDALTIKRHNKNVSRLNVSRCFTNSITSWRVNLPLCLPARLTAINRYLNKNNPVPAFQRSRPKMFEIWDIRLLCAPVCVRVCVWLLGTYFIMKSNGDSCGTGDKCCMSKGKYRKSK